MNKINLEDLRNYKLKYTKDYIYDKTKDRIPAKLQSILYSFTDEVFEGETHEEIRRIINEMN